MREVGASPVATAPNTAWTQARVAHGTAHRFRQVGGDRRRGGQVRVVRRPEEREAMQGPTRTDSQEAARLLIDGVERLGGGAGIPRGAAG